MKSTFGKVAKTGAWALLAYEGINLLTGGGLSIPLLAADFALAALGKILDPQPATPSPAIA